MKQDYWLNKWKTLDIRFNQSSPHPKLLQYFTPRPRTKVMVPLCGKSIDLLWLRSQGHEIVGIELSQIACESFFFEHALSFEKFNHGDCILYQSDGISIWCGDFFRVPPLAWKDCTFVYDRAGMVALPEDLRILYTQHLIRNFVGDNKQILLIAVEYQQGKVAGPPFSVMESEVKDRFQSNFMITKLETNSDNSLSDRADKFGAIEVNETVYWLVQK